MAGLAPSEAFLLGLLMTVFSLSPFLLASDYARLCPDFFFSSDWVRAHPLDDLPKGPMFK